MKIDDNYLPLNVEIEDSNDLLLWTEGYHDEKMFKAVLHASWFLKETGFKTVLMICFNDVLTGQCVADISLERDSAIHSLKGAQDYFVEKELYEEAAITRDMIEFFKSE